MFTWLCSDIHTVTLKTAKTYCQMAKHRITASSESTPAQSATISRNLILAFVSTTFWRSLVQPLP